MKALRSYATLRQQARRLLLLILVVVGALSGLTAVVFHHALEAARGLLIGRALMLPGPARALGIVLIPAVLGGLLAVLVPKLSPDAGGGLTLVRTAYGQDPARLDLRAWLGTFLATPLSLGSGAPLGPEGPTVVLTSGLAVGVGRLLGFPARVVRGMIPVGTAAGIAAIFNTPITGVVFALEEVIGTASRGVLGGAIVAAVAAAVVQKSALGGRPLLEAAPAGWREAPELLGFALLGLIAGTTAGLLPRIVPKARAALWRLADRLGPYPLLARGVLAGLAVGLLGVVSPASLGIGYEPVSAWLAGKGDGVAAGVAFLAKAAGVCVSLGAPLVGGVFAPSLFLGASLGASLGQLFRVLSPASPIDPGAYALVGMGAFFAGFLRTPIASVLIVFELTGDYALVVPLMLAVAISSLVARKLSPATLVERQLEAAGVAPGGTGVDPLARQHVRDAMTTRVICLNARSTLEEAWPVAEANGYPLYPVVDDEGNCVGVLELDALERATREPGGTSGVSSLMRPARVLATPDETLDRLSLRLGAARETRCPVVESVKRPRLLGFVSPADLLRARLRVQAETETPFEPLG